MLELKGINKWFGKNHANNDVNLKVVPNTIHGIIGENGAGKSTLVNIIYGFYQADEGEIFIDSKKSIIDSTKAAIVNGIGMVHQHFMLIDTFNSIENILLGAEKNFLLSKNYDSVLQKVEEIQKNYNISINLRSVVGDLAVGEKQRIEIFKSLYRDAKILILDEPTSVLTPQEVRELFVILKKLKKEGVTILFITHKLKEILEITDNVSVMRKGGIVNTMPTKKTSSKELAKLMIGREILKTQEKRKKITNKKIFQVKGLFYKDSWNVPRLQDINIELFAGEILGIAGISGNGQTELLEILSGMIPIQEGEIIFAKQSFSAKNNLNPRIARELGLMHIPEDRLGVGTLKEFCAVDNSVLGYHQTPRYTNKNFLKLKDIYNDCIDYINKFDIRPTNPYLRFGNFSGGNQQKLLFAREMKKNASIFLVGQPTRGVDIGAIESIHKKILKERDNQKAILLVSSELDEILALSDRIIVMFQGRIVGEMLTKNTTAQKLGLLMGGKK